MRKPRLLFLLIAAFVVVVVLVSGVFVVRNWLFSPLVTVTVCNAVDRPVEVNLTHETGAVVVGTLRPGQEQVVRFDPGQTESTYLLSAEVGSRTVTVHQYVEPGYRVRETINASGIETKR